MKACIRRACASPRRELGVFEALARGRAHEEEGAHRGPGMQASRDRLIAQICGSEQQAPAVSPQSHRALIAPRCVAPRIARPATSAASDICSCGASVLVAAAPYLLASLLLRGVISRSARAQRTPRMSASSRRLHQNFEARTHAHDLMREHTPRTHAAITRCNHTLQSHAAITRCIHALQSRAAFTRCIHARANAHVLNLRALACGRV